MTTLCEINRVRFSNKLKMPINILRNEETGNTVQKGFYARKSVQFILVCCNITISICIVSHQQAIVK